MDEAVDPLPLLVAGTGRLLVVAFGNSGIMCLFTEHRFAAFALPVATSLLSPRRLPSLPFSLC